MTWIKAVPIWAWVCLGLVLLCGWQTVQLADVRAEFAEYRSDAAEAGREAEKAAREKERQWNAKFAELQEDAKREADRRARDSAAASDSLRRLLDRAKAAEVSSRACGDSIAAQLSSATDPATGVFANLLSGMGEAAGQYAAIADERFDAGNKCEAAYNALKPP